MGNILQFIKCFLGYHKWVEIGVFTHRGMSDDHVYINGCSFCGQVKFLHVRFKPVPPEDKEVK